MYKLLLPLMITTTAMFLSVSIVHAASGTTDVQLCTGTGTIKSEMCSSRIHLQQTREANMVRRESNKSLRTTNSGALRDFHINNSGAIRDTTKSLTGSDRDAWKDAREDNKEAMLSLLGKTLEEALNQRPQLEDTARIAIEARYKNNPELLTKRLAVYNANKTRRDEIATNRLTSLLERSSARSSQVSVFVKSVEARLSTFTPEQKAKLSAKIDEQISKINSSKVLTAEVKTSMTLELTTIKEKLQ